jgi:hypothetical protein
MYVQKTTAFKHMLMVYPGEGAGIKMKVDLLRFAGQIDIVFGENTVSNLFPASSVVINIIFKVRKISNMLGKEMLHE